MRRILSIDGGGIRGALPASFLATLEDSLGQPVADYFDLIVCTSTRGIIALGLGAGLTANEILSFYETHGPKIFAGNRLLRYLRQIGFSKYDPAPLRNALQVVFENKKLGDSTKRLVIPSLNLDSGEVHVWKTSHHLRLERDYKCTMVEVAMATAAAPTYFPTLTCLGFLYQRYLRRFVSLTLSWRASRQSLPTLALESISNSATWRTRLELSSEAP
jgi:patatin-like phospholipase/acyl hydrolase